jgi:chromosome segregation ATPase
LIICHFPSEFYRKELESARNELQLQQDAAKSNACTTVAEFELRLSNEKAKYDTSLTLLKEELRNAKLQLDRIKGMESEFLAKLQDQDSDAARLNGCVRELETELQRVCAEKRSVTDMVGVLTADKEATRKDMERLSEGYSVLQFDLAQLKNQEAQFTEDRARLSTDLAAAQTTIAELSAQNQLLVTTNVDVAALKESLAAEISNLHEAAKIAEAAVVTPMTPFVAIVDAQMQTIPLPDVSSELAVSLASLAALRLENTVSKNKCQEIQLMLTESETAAARLKVADSEFRRNQSEELQARIEAWNKERAQLATENERLNHVLLESKENVKRLEASAEAASVAHQSTVSDLQSNMELLTTSMETAISQLNGKLIHQKEEIARNEQQLAVVLAEKLHLESLIETLNKRNVSSISDAVAKAKEECNNQLLNITSSLNELQAKCAGKERQLEDVKQQHSELHRLYELSQSEILGGRQAVEKLLALNALNINLQGRISELEAQLATAKSSVATSDLQRQQAEETFKAAYSVLESKCANLKDDYDYQLKEAANRLENEKFAVELLTKEKEALAKNLLECQLEVVSLRDAALTWQSEHSACSGQLQSVATQYSALEVLKAELDQEIRSSRQLVDESKHQANVKATEVVLLQTEIIELKTELARYRSREAEILAVLNLQTQALQEAEKRENEYHSHRAYLAGSETQVRELVNKAIKAEEKALKHVLELESQLADLASRLKETEEQKAVVNSSLAKKKNELVHLSRQLEKLLQGELTPDKLIADVNVEHCRTLVAEAGPHSETKSMSSDGSALECEPGYLQWHDKLVELVLELHQSLVVTIQRFHNESKPVGGNGTISKLAMQSSLACLISLSESFDAMQCVVMKFPSQFGADPVPTLPAPHMLSAVNFDKTAAVEGLNLSGTSASDVSPAKLKGVQNKENETPPRKHVISNRLAIKDEKKLSGRQLFPEDVLKPVVEQSEKRDVVRNIKGIPPSQQTFSVRSCDLSSVAKPMVSNNAPSLLQSGNVDDSLVFSVCEDANETEFWNLSSDGEEDLTNRHK